MQLNASSDTILEGNETLLVHLSSPNNQEAIITPNQGTVTIIDHTGMYSDSRILFSINFFSQVVSLTLEQSQYDVVEGDLSVEVCVGFSGTYIIQRMVHATLETSSSGKQFFTNGH